MLPLKKCKPIVIALAFPLTAFAQQWEFIGLGYEKINTIAVDARNPNVLYVGSESVYADTFGFGGIFKSTNGGVAWDTVAASASVSKIVIHPSNSNIIYAALNSANSMRPGIVKSTDAGQTWFYADSGIFIQYPADFRGIAIDPHHPETLYCGEAGNFPRPLWKSTVGGMYWFPSDSGGMRNNTTGRNIVIDAESTNIVYATTSGAGGGVWKTTDGGTFWFALGVPWAPGVLEMDPHDPATLYAEGPEVAKTTNKGVTWQFMSYDSVGLAGTAVLAFHPDTIHLWYAGSSNIIYLSRDGGIHWQLMNPPIQGVNGYVQVLTTTPSGSALYAGFWGASYSDGSGIYRYVFPTMGVPVREKVPKNFHLYQNYPNPFNPSTQITYQLSRRSYIRLEVYDVLGREVATLVNGTEDPGHKSVRFNASNLASGVYFYRLQAGDFVQTKKLLLLR